ncbi:hypothetical protein CMV30_06080 [Nibricoccus aquaticus]|uniref:DUF1501 domain-containing protein n=1 Tax=Nibricoccus aquaticus TaxID=2576891 RepID=A0A290QBF4_9BACT|nr:DUF1501 domain-containing protein [Nibricoccus aquaticus]ATC63556.1 hypothetical protein CMV30_06080 [Nibricoccus aquaticus]
MNTARYSEFSRRQFVRSAGVGLAALAFQPIFPRVFASSRAPSSPDPRVLVIIHLQGGHDGLNTCVPFQDDRYYRARPTLALGREDLIRIDDTWALNRAGKPFEALFKDGKMAVVPDASYPQPSDSHYRASEIWHTASAADEVLYSGWVGRCFSHLQAQGRAVRGLYASPARPRIFVREEDRTARANVAAAGGDICGSLNAAGSAPLDALAEIGERAGASADTEIYFVAVPGFDTHARQLETQSARLHALSRALQLFQQRIEQRSIADRVLTMAFSEFGRSATENAQGGTDHGGGSPVFLVGKNVRGGFTPGGNSASHDFKQILRPIVTDWLGVPVQAVFARDPGRVELLRVFAQT